MDHQVLIIATGVGVTLDDASGGVKERTKKEASI
jgi:hypothetical protein